MEGRSAFVFDGSVPPTILVIDDEPQIRRVVKNAFQAAGAKVVEAATGTEGIDLAAAQRPDLIILDLGLPDIVRRRGLPRDPQMVRALRSWCSPRATRTKRRSRSWTPAPTTTSPSRSARPSSRRGCERCSGESPATTGGRPDRHRRAGARPRRAHGDVAPESSLHLTPHGMGAAALADDQRRSGADPPTAFPSVWSGRSVRRRAAVSARLRGAAAPQDRARPCSAPLHPYGAGRGLSLRHLFGRPVHGNSHAAGRSRAGLGRIIPGLGGGHAGLIPVPISPGQGARRARLSPGRARPAASGGGRSLGLALAGSAFLLFNWFFLPPYNTLVISNPLDWLVLLAFLIVSVVAAQLLHRERRRAEEARQRSATRWTGSPRSGAETLSVGRADQALTAITDRDSRDARDRGMPNPPGASGGDDTTGLGRSAAGWAAQSGQIVRRRADGTPWGWQAPAEHSLESGLGSEDGVRGLLVPLQVRDRAVGVLELGRRGL